MLAGGYAGLLGLSRLGYRTVLYPAPRRGVSEAPVGAELRTFTAADGTPVQALVYPPPGRRSLVFFHGNGETIGDSIGLAVELHRRGLGFVAVEYRGYGSSPATGPSEDGLYADADAVLRTLASEGLAAADVTLWGSSLGSGVAVEMATRGHGSRLLLSTPYTSIPRVAQRLVPVIPMGWVVGDRYDNLAKAPEIDLPTLIIHGDADRLVPYDHGVTLSRAIAGARLITVAGAGHNDWLALGGDGLVDEIVQFVTEPVDPPGDASESRH
ncbi:MAG: alpha/beta hydrolase [Deltaproteobacteria bacterium]|nr:alpha/beta hydrolase [Deltaproteobacteria bacterium]